MNEADEKRAEAPQGDQPLASQGTGDRTVDYAGGSSGADGASKPDDTEEFKPVRVTLRKTIEVGGKRFDTLHVEEPTAGGIEAAQREVNRGGGPISALMALVAYESGWPMDAVRKMPLSELNKVGDALRPFLSAIEEAGGGSKTNSNS